jgi:fido (protein-threonine AMPylation protein)
MSAYAQLPEVFPGTVAPRSTLSSAVARGDLRRLGRGLYTRNLTDPEAEVVRRNLYDVVAAIYPDALIADRSARLGARPASDGSLFIVHRRSNETALPGLVIRPRSGKEAIQGDLPLPQGLHMTSVARALLENTVRSRSRAGRVARTLTRAELEEWLETLIEQRGEQGFRALREQVRRLAPQLQFDAELTELDPLMGAVLGTRTDVKAESAQLRSRQKGHPFDARRVELLGTLFEALGEISPIVRPVSDSTADRYRFLPFFEAYFSNFIEGTEFEVDEAREIIFDRVIPAARPADAHDIMGTYLLVSDTEEMARRARTADEFIELLRSRHRVLLKGRPEKHPGEFKLLPNRAGNVPFVAPELVEGTLREGFRYYERLSNSFARATFQMFLVSEVHPFDEGNGRIARVMMNAELVGASEHRIIIPLVYRNNYLMALRALTVNRRTDALVSTLDFAQRYTAAIDFSDFDQARDTLRRTNAFADPAEADHAGVRLVLPASSTEAWEVVGGPRKYDHTPEGADIDVGWAWDVRRTGETRSVRVEVAGGRLDSLHLPDESRRAIATEGRSALEPYLRTGEPPSRILVTSTGIFTR